MKIPKGRAQARASERMKISIQVSSVRLSDANNLASNMSYGLLELKSYVKLSGKGTLFQHCKWGQFRQHDSEQMSVVKGKF
ncbi:hypothetical protein Gotri_024075 [Gossypium trilobum]|uniref:Uncharacterized protein n=1 Tax=Gossypium trilobum TaxID=34281 RepID=A0A7J9DL21_9ROSI|nr:hypothetical protein [Gossypium trilobum]